MKHLPKFIFIVALLCMSPKDHAVAGETITWLVMHRPPGMMLDQSGKTITGGATGNQLLMVQSELKHYAHVNSQMNWGRFWNEVSQGKNLCNSISFKTPDREAVAEFSTPVAFILPLHIVLRKGTYDSLGKPESISFTDLVQLKLKGGFIDNRSYSDPIDALLQNLQKTSDISRYVVNIQRLTLMLMHKRFDYTLEYPPAINFVLENLPPREKTTELVTIPVKELDPFYYVYIACTKNEWGKRVVRDLNSALKKLRKSPRYRNTMKEAYTGEQLEKVMAIYDDHFIHLGSE